MNSSYITIEPNQLGFRDEPVIEQYLFNKSNTVAQSVLIIAFIRQIYHQTFKKPFENNDEINFSKNVTLQRGSFKRRFQKRPESNPTTDWI